VCQQIVRRTPSRDFLERCARLLQIRQHEFLRQRATRGRRRRARASSASCARCTSAMCRTFVIAGRSRSGADEPSVNSSTIARRNSSRPAPVFAETLSGESRLT
jgi:hypothetical protein